MTENKVGFEDIFDASLKKDIEDFKKSIAELKSGLNDLSKIKPVELVDKGSGKDAQAAADGVEQLNKAGKEAITVQRELEKAQKQLESSQARLAAVTSEEYKELDRLNQETKEAIKIEQEKIRTSKAATDSNIALIAKNKELRKEIDLLSNSDKQALARKREINKQIDANLKLMRKEQDSDRARISNIGNYKSALTGLVQAQGGAASGFMEMAKAALAFIATPIGAILGSVVGAVMLVVKAFKTFEPVLDFIEQKIGMVVGAFTALKESVVGLFSGEGGKALDGLGEKMKKAAKEGEAVVKMTQNLEDATDRSGLSQKKYQKEIDRLIIQAKDRTKSEAERIKMLDEAEALELKAFNERKKLVDQEIELNVRKIATGRNLTDEEIKRLKEEGIAYGQTLQEKKAISRDELLTLQSSLEKREDIERESFVFQEKLINRRNVILDKQEEENKKRQEKQAADAAKAKEAQIKADEELAKSKEVLKNANADFNNQLFDDFEKRQEIAEKTYTLEETLAKNAGKTEEELAVKRKQFSIEQAKERLEAMRMLIGIDKDITKESIEEAEIQVKQFQAELQGLLTGTKEEGGILAGLLGTTDEQLAKTFSKINEVTQKVASVAQAGADIYAAYDQLQRNREAEELARFEKLNDDKQKDYKDQLDAGIISQERYKELSKKQEKDLEKEKKRIAKDQAKRNKQLALFDAIINTAVGVTSSLKSGGILGIVLAALVAIAGAVQIAAISSQPEPSFKKGGEFDWSEIGGYTGDGSTNDESRKLGRKPYTYHKKEYIWDANTYARNKDLIKGLKTGEITKDMLRRGAIDSTLGAMLDIRKVEEEVRANREATEKLLSYFKYEQKGPYFQDSKTGYIYQHVGSNSLVRIKEMPKMTEMP